MNEKNLGPLLHEGKQRLREASIDSWALDAELIMAHVTGLKREQLITHGGRKLNESQAAAFNGNIEKRVGFMPVQYITGKAEFMGLPFHVDERVLIPRPDTEILVEAAIDYIRRNNVQSVLDLCTGSGVIAVSIAKYCPAAVQVTAADISAQALAVAEKNACMNQVAGKVQFVESNMFQNIAGSFDMIVSNPPYIEKAAIAGLQSNVKDYEPLLALDGGVDGLDFYRVLANESPRHLKPDSRIFLEIGADQKKEISTIFTMKNYNLLSVIKDLAGLDRTLIFSKNRVCL